MEEITELLTDKEKEELLKSLPIKFWILFAISVFLAILKHLKLIIFKNL